MAETRTYDPSSGDPIGDAVRAALGETVRPNVPGMKPTGQSPARQQPPTIATIGSFTFTSAPPPQPPAK